MLSVQIDKRQEGLYEHWHWKLNTLLAAQDYNAKAAAKYVQHLG